MAETHELRLKINAAAARAGAREFVAAIQSIQTAVEVLQRKSTTAFDGINERSRTAATGLTGLASQYNSARSANERFAASIAKTNTALARQASLAAQAGRVSAPSTPRSTTASPNSRAADQQISVQNRVKRAVDDTRLSVERLTNSLMKVGGFQSVNELAAAYRRFQKDVSGSAVTAQKLDTAKTRLNTTIKAAQTSLVTLTSKMQDAQRAEKAAATAARERANATERVAKQQRAAADAQRAQNAAADRTARTQLAAAQAMRQAEQEAARLKARLSAIGDVRGISAVNAAIVRLRGSLSAAGDSTLKVRQSFSQFQDVTTRAKIALTKADAAQAAAARSARALADSQRSAAAAARNVDREMRSLAGANNAASQAMRNATGNLRGLENAFSGTFQAGSLFRTMLGSITFGTFAQGVFQAGDALDQFRVSMEVAMGGASAAMGELDYADELASRLGVSLQSVRDNYSKFAISADIAGVSANETRHIFESVSTAMAVLGKSTEDQNLAFLALEQMMSKGKVSSEELRRQLGERLPGAVNMMAQALGVGVDKLQEMLKAGEINSADALPKFADVLMERFGPGLEQASRRAGNNLQKLRNEITKFLEEVAQAGVMDELAAQFRRLTNTLASGGGLSAAQALGEGLANMARVGGDALVFLIENIDKFGAAIKAVAIGLIVRQIGLMGAAIATSVQQITGYIGASRAQTAVTTKLSAATVGLNGALLKNAAASKTAGASTALLARQQTLALRAALTQRTTFFGLSGALTAFTAASGRAAVAAGALARGLSVIAPVVGLAVTAMLLIPGAADAIGFSTDNMSSKVNAAMSRAGVAFDEFGQTVRDTASNMELDRILNDLRLLEQAATRLGNAGQGRDGLLGNFVMDGELALGAAVMQLEEDTGRLERVIADYGRVVSGFGSFDQSAVGGGGSAAIKDMFMDYLSLTEAQGDAVALQDKLNATMIRFPDTVPILEEFRVLIDQQVALEQAISNNVDSLTRLFGTNSEQLLLNFAETAKAVIRTGEGIDGLNSLQAELMENSPQAAAEILKIRDAFEETLAMGNSPLHFQQAVQDLYSGTATEIRALREEVDATQAAVGESINALHTQLGTTVESLQSIDLSDGWFSGFDGLDESLVESYRQLFATFAEFQAGEGLALTLDQLTLLATSLETSVPAVQLFRDELLSQWQALQPAEQTYSRLDSLIRQLSSQFPQASAEIGRFSQTLLENARAGDASVMAYSDLERAVAALPWPTDEARAAAYEMLGLAQNTQAAGNAADGATGSLYSAAGGTDAIADGAANATAQVRALQAALAALGAVAAGVQAAAADIVSDINFQAQQKAAPIYERAMNQFVRDQQRVIDDAYSEATSKLDAGTPGGGYMARQAALDRQAAMTELEKGAADIRAASENLYNTEAWRDPNRRRGGGGGGRRRGGRRSGGGRSGGGGGAGGAASAADKLTEAVKRLTEGMEKSLDSINGENAALTLLTQGFTTSERAARMLGEAQAAGVNIFDEQTVAMVRQIEAAEKLNEALTRLANDPVNDWMNSVPTWREAGQQIETGVLNHLSDAISNFIKTGEFSFEALGEAILGTVADIIADKAVKELATLLGGNTTGSGEGGFGLGGLFSNLFGNGGSAGDDPDPFASGFGGGDQGAAMQNAMVSGGQQAAQSIQTAMIQAGQQVGQQITTGGQAAGAQMGSQVQTAGSVAGSQMMAQTSTGGTIAGTQMMSQTQTGGTIAAQQMQQGIMQGGAAAAQQMAAASAGGGGGGLFGGGFGGGFLGIGLSLIGGLLSSRRNKKSESSGPKEPVTPVGIRQYAEGTPNTSGIPAILHDNEAVIPLSKGRKVPVEFGDDMGSGRGGDRTVVQNFNITTPDADSFRKSQKQIAADAASSGQKAMSDNT